MSSFWPPASADFLAADIAMTEAMPPTTMTPLITSPWGLPRVWLSWCQPKAGQSPVKTVEMLRFMAGLMPAHLRAKVETLCAALNAAASSQSAIPTDPTGPATR